MKEELYTACVHACTHMHLHTHTYFRPVSFLSETSVLILVQDTSFIKQCYQKSIVWAYTYSFGNTGIKECLALAYSGFSLLLASWLWMVYYVCGVGIASLLLFPEDDSAESSQQEDDESEAGETDEQDAEEFALADEQLERRR